VGGDAGQHVMEILVDVDAVVVAGGDEGEENGGGVAAALASVYSCVLG
jgi:hypothetical protein